MTGRTIEISNSDEVMAMLGTPCVFYRGRWQDVMITEVSKDEDTPLSVRESLVGLIIPTIFGQKQLESQGVNLPVRDGSRLAYADDVVNVLAVAGKHDEAEQLRRVAPSPLDMYVIGGEVYTLI